MNETIEVLMKYQTEVNRLNEVQLAQAKQIEALNSTIKEISAALISTCERLAQVGKSHMSLLKVLTGEDPT
jgi:vacuolar-type H+-ATPase subunit I/STV1